MKITKSTIKRGAILQAKSGKTAGHFYLLTRTMAGRDNTKDFLGNDIPSPGTLRYAFNLVNITDKGAARQTEVERQLITTIDGIERGLNLNDLIAHYNLDLVDVTDIASIKVEMREVLEEKAQEKKDAQDMAGLSALYLLIIGGQTKTVPIFGPDGHTVISFVAMPN